uniref:Methylthioribose-1-phosphate isomerase n=1 Tax=Timspurckia oligopyrenoides TaxID=708627 RepID=A0A7S1ETN3_9RHOD|mmetsp:Transcript_6562/g.11725  ORF Transcript_6562/g.11725 Transcript_6562/m.11725 type:complete len:380 (+) Transcript_6562:60-1199(+)
MKYTTVDLIEDGRCVELLDQRVLPSEVKYIQLRSTQQVCDAIRTMVVRGAPAIGATAAYGYSMALKYYSDDNPCVTSKQLFDFMNSVYDQLYYSRPTAVNLAWALRRQKQVVLEYVRLKLNVDESDDEIQGNTLREIDVVALSQILEHDAKEIAQDDIKINQTMGRFGSELLPKVCNVLHHCNTGALATVDHGTALGVIRTAVFEQKKNVHVWVDETRPRLQGARLTAWELQADGIDMTLICDSMAASLMRAGKVDAVLVGADRISANGDTANKIGTYHLACAAKVHSVPFYVVAPCSTVDLSIESGAQIPIEERDPSEVTNPSGESSIAPSGIQVYNPAFDVTPADFISAIITEHGVLRPPYEPALRSAVAQSKSKTR